MKARVLLLLTILGPFIYILFYVLNTATDLAFRDDMYLIKGGFIESYCNGTLTFKDLWRPASADRMLGYGILQLINIKLFGMNSKLIVLLIPFLMLSSAILIYQDYKKSLKHIFSPGLTASTYLIATVIIFNIIQWEGLTFSIGLVFQAAMPFFIATFMSLEAFKSRFNNKYLFLLLIISILSVLVFGGSRIFSFVLALCVTFVCSLLTSRNNLPDGFWPRSLLIFTWFALIVFLYIYRINDNNYFPESLPNIWIELKNPFKTLQFFLAAFGASLFGVNFANAYLPFQVMVLLGFVVVSFYILATIFFFYTNMYKSTYMPFFLIINTFFYLGCMTLSRLNFGIGYGMSSRYTCISLYGLVALAWIAIFTIAVRPRVNTRWRVVFFSAILFIVCGIILTAIIEWRIQPYRKTYFEQLKNIALNVDNAAQEGLAKFEERPDLVRDSLRILRECRLNVYRPVSKIMEGQKQIPSLGDSTAGLRSNIALDHENYQHLKGAYEREGNMRWASPEFSLVLWRTNQNMVSAEVTVPEGLIGFKGEMRNKISVKLRLFAKDCAGATLPILKPGRYIIEAPITCAPLKGGAPFEITLNLNSTLDPRDIAPDIRSLAFQLHTVKLLNHPQME